MSTLTREPKSGTRTILQSNPILRRMSKITERSDTNAATYRGIAMKTTFFLVVTLAGMIAQLLVMTSSLSQPVWQKIQIYEKFTMEISKTELIIVGAVLLVGFICEMLGIFVRKTVPVTGTIYSASQGYLISFLVFKVLKGYEYLGLEALLLTVAVVAVMSWLYSTGKIKADKKFHTVLLSLVIGSVGLGLLTFLGSLIPATRQYVQDVMSNPLISIGLDVVGLVIAALFLISDFSMINDCVQLGYPKEYEWSAAFGLTFTVIWIYLKILDLLMQIVGKKDD